ncbi:11560_t:CDS:2, partial [Acaulospora morrowiae]
MSFIKTSLKNARDAIKAKNYEDVIKHCQNVLQYEADNYNAYVFLGVAQLNLNKPDESEKAYQRAIEINSSQLLAWQGLANFYEKQENWVKLGETWVELLNRHKEKSESKEALDMINKIVDLHLNKEKVKKKAVETLKYLLPTSPYYKLIQDLDNFPPPKQTLLRIIELLEQDESETIKREIEARRYRLNAGTLATIRVQVENEVYGSSELEGFYDSLFEIVDNSSEASDINKSEISVGYISHLQKKLNAIPSENRRRVLTALNEKIIKRAEQLVEQNDTTSSLPYEILIDRTNAVTLDDYDEDLLKGYCEKFPDTGLSKIIQAYFRALQGDTSEAHELYQ